MLSMPFWSEQNPEVDKFVILGPGMERKDLLNENGKIFVDTGKALNDNADRNCKVVVVGNPANTNCLIASHWAKDLPKENFTVIIT